MAPAITIDGITYLVLDEKEFVVTPEQVSTLKASVVRTRLFLKRPRGKRHYIAYRYENGLYSSVI